MKLNKLVYLLVVALAFTSGVTGCKKKPVGPTPLPPVKQGPGGDSPIEGSGSLKPGDDTGVGVPQPDFGGNLEEKFNFDRATLAPHTVHFDYDSAAIRSSEQAHVEAVASHQKSAGTALLIEGHCDERGTEEYNRALGERRALALRNELIKLGCDGGKIVTRSFGKDRRIDLSETEAGHSRNRRGEFVVLTPK